MIHTITLYPNIPQFRVSKVSSLVVWGFVAFNQFTVFAVSLPFESLLCTTITTRGCLTALFTYLFSGIVLERKMVEWSLILIPLWPFLR